MSVRMVLLGPPGAGKGTQAARISERLNIPAISTGDIFRKNIAEGTELGKAAKSYIDKGEYVPNEVTNGLVRDRLHWDDAVEGFLLDGYPRTLDQVEELERMLDADGLSLDVAVEITADTEEIVKRLLKRATEQNRADDTEPVIRHRMEVYTAQTQPLVDVYRDMGLLVQVDGIGEIDEVTERIYEALSEKLGRQI
ncbi:adenylate kinase [Actinomyces graevenitzii]|uniref:adenylate kinase n=1 Tax=Actinomyces graevenitzii TaxID=55565 RepID=UPI0015E0F869|nr:adenylate kinase [Actinomyces graevenitzii]